MDGTGPSRRRFVIGSLAGLSSAWLASRWPSMLPVRSHAPHLEFFSPEQAMEIEAVASQIIPEDETPGAREAGVVYFIDRALATFERDEQETYTQGLAELRAKTSQLFPGARRFSQLAAEQQVEVLKAVEETRFFKRVRAHSVAGFLGSPAYGANRAKVGWELIGFEDSFAFEPPFGYYDRDHHKGRKA
jgi:gluconate 2-dehydrogenase gamma chain